MSRLSNDKATRDDLIQKLMDSAFSGHGISDPSAQTSAAITLAYTTDDPAYTPDGSVLVADGDDVQPAEEIQLTEEIIATINTLVADVTAIRTALVNYLDTDIEGISALADMTSLFDLGDADAITYTTDDPAITPNAAVTVADGDLTTAAEYHEYCVEAFDQLGKIWDDVGALHREVQLLVSVGVGQTAALAARTSNVGGIPVTYTTDDPSVTPNNTFTIADGDLFPVAARNEAIAETEDDIDKLGDDYLALRTTYEAIRTAAGL